MIRAISHAFPVTSNATRSSGPRLAANSSIRSGVVAIRPAERSSPSSTSATSQKSRCTSNPIDLPITALPSTRLDRPGDAVGKRHRPIRAPGATGQVAAAATEKPALDRPSSKNRPTQHAFSQRPLSRSPDPNRPDPEHQPSSPFSCPEGESSRPELDGCLLLAQSSSAPANRASPAELVGELCPHRPHLLFDPSHDVDEYVM